MVVSTGRELLQHHEHAADLLIPTSHELTVGLDSAQGQLYIQPGFADRLAPDL